jgi:hypothetical protein
VSNGLKGETQDEQWEQWTQDKLGINAENVPLNVGWAVGAVNLGNKKEERLQRATERGMDVGWVVGAVNLGNKKRGTQNVRAVRVMYAAYTWETLPT